MESFIALCLLLMIGHVLRIKIRLLQWLYLPSCVIAGLVGLAILQLAPKIGWQIPAAWTAGWSRLPSILINVVFACLFLGVKIPNIRTIWRHAGPQLAYGQVVAWGQYVVGVGVFLVMLRYFFPELPVMFGGILPVGFEGGHGTASGLKETFIKNHWPQGVHFALASATIGMTSAVIVGMVLVNWAVRRGYAVYRKKPSDVAEDDTIGIIPIDQRPSAGKLTVKADAIESLTLHLAVVGVAILIGVVIRAALVGLGRLSQPSVFAKIMESFPLFPLCMIGGIIVQIWEQKWDRYKLIDHGLTRRIQNCALDFLVVSAIAMILIETITSAWAPFVTLMGMGIAWNVFCVLFLARRMLPDVWFERSIAEMGQSMGVTATGLLLLRVVDPDYETPAADAFAYKQILHEPFMGGGLWTSAAIPLLAIYGGWPVFGIACGAMAIWLVVTFCTPIIRGRREAST